MQKKTYRGNGAIFLLIHVHFLAIINSTGPPNRDPGNRLILDFIVNVTFWVKKKLVPFHASVFCGEFFFLGVHVENIIKHIMFNVDVVFETFRIFFKCVSVLRANRANIFDVIVNF